MAMTSEVRPGTGLQQRISDAITGFCGDIRFVYVHIVAFAVWIATKGFGNDSFPFNFLTMAVSLEAIFLSTFILISQNRQQAMAEAHNDSVQRKLQQMLTDVISDEKMDHQNERMITELLNRIDVEHVRPLAEQIDRVGTCVARIESGLSPGGAAAGDPNGDAPRKDG